jgi:ABC-2 type transport system permease protein
MSRSWQRIRVLAGKDAAEVRRQPGLILPAIGMVLGLSLPAFLLLVVAPRLTGEPLADSDFAEAAQQVVSQIPALAELTLEGQAQAFILQQFLMFSLLVPITGSLSLAAQGIVGEKQARSLEPLLTTPLSVWELLLGKILTPLVLSLLLLGATYLLYLAGMGAFGEPGVWRTLYWPRTLVLYLIVGPLVTFTALLIAAIVSSRVNDARTAQQLGAFLTLPITGLFVAQLAGQFLLGVPALLVTALVLVVANVALLWAGVRVFRRDTILMRWK